MASLLSLLRLSFKMGILAISKYFVHENTLDRCVSLFNTQGRGEREEQQQQSCLMGKTFFLVSKCGRLFQTLTTWGHSSFLGPRLMRESNRSGGG